MDTKAALNSLSSLNRSAFVDDEPGRVEALNEARAAVRRLERPGERIYDMIWIEPLLMLTVKLSSDMGLFGALSSTPLSSEQLAKATGTDAALVSRLCRFLAADCVIVETDVDTYVDTDLARALNASDGLVGGIHHFFEVGVPQLAKTPEYFRSTGYKNPSDAAHPPWEYIMGSPSMWQYFKEHPEAGAHFQSLLSCFRGESIPWPTSYRPSRLLDGFDASTILCVDVGGGKGADMRQLAHAVPPHQPGAKLVVQDLPAVVQKARAEDLPVQIELMAHNFFEEQPIKAARAYFMHSICHDWPDADAGKILTRLKEAGRPGYSKILLLEAVMPESVKEMPRRMAAMDVNMMLHFSALERTEKQWRALVEGVGLRFAKVWPLTGHWQGIIEIDI